MTAVYVTGGFLGLCALCVVAACILAGRADLRAACFPPREDVEQRVIEEYEREFGGAA